MRIENVNIGIPDLRPPYRIFYNICYTDTGTPKNGVEFI